MRRLLAVVCALGCVVGAGHAQASDAQAQQIALTPIERAQAADGYPSQPAAKVLAAAPISEAGQTPNRLPAGALLFAVAFWSMVCLTKRSRGAGPATATADRPAAYYLEISDAPAALESALPVAHLERRRSSDRGTDRRSGDAHERRS